MVRAELAYNPYLLETEVRFNNMSPRINSLVEKYKNEKLQTWISKVPSVFYDEMNGYYFELDFSGTNLDFEELKKSFMQAGVGKDLVQLFHKGDLAERREKLHEIEELLKWLEETPNRKFDFETFRNEHRDIFDNIFNGFHFFSSVNGYKLSGLQYPDLFLASAFQYMMTYMTNYSINSDNYADIVPTSHFIRKSYVITILIFIPDILNYTH